MTGGKISEQIEITLRHNSRDEYLPVYIDVYESSLSAKWLNALNDLLNQDFHLEKNFCFMGFVNSPRNGEYICSQINETIHAINHSGIGYTINDHFTLDNTITDEPSADGPMGRNLIHDRMNHLHRYFEDLQGVSGRMSPYYEAADPTVRWHIRQINLLCHEFESWALSYRKELEAPEWTTPTNLFCWLNAPRFKLEEEDYELFGLHTITRPTGAVYVGVNKGVGKHHYEVFRDEGDDSRIDELTTSTLRGQEEAAGDFDIEWGRSCEKIANRQREVEKFRAWLIENGFDPEDRSLTIGHPQVGAVDMKRSFSTEDPQKFWPILDQYLDVYSIKTSSAENTFDYRWSDPDFKQRQIDIISGK